MRRAIGRLVCVTPPERDGTEKQKGRCVASPLCHVVSPLRGRVARQRVRRPPQVLAPPQVLPQWVQQPEPRALPQVPPEWPLPEQVPQVAVQPGSVPAGSVQAACQARPACR